MVLTKFRLEFPAHLQRFALKLRLKEKYGRGVHTNSIDTAIPATDSAYRTHVELLVTPSE